MGIETSTKKTGHLDKSNMTIAIGKRKRESNESNFLVITVSKLEKNLLAFFPKQQIQRN
jgi:hypothetical protein